MAEDSNKHALHEAILTATRERINELIDALDAGAPADQAKVALTEWLESGCTDHDQRAIAAGHLADLPAAGDYRRMLKRGD